MVTVDRLSQSLWARIPEETEGEAKKILNRVI